MRPFVTSQRRWWLPECESHTCCWPLPPRCRHQPHKRASVMSCQVENKPAPTGFARPLVFTPRETLLTRVFVWRSRSGRFNISTRQTTGDLPCLERRVNWRFWGSEDPTYQLGRFHFIPSSTWTQGQIWFSKKSFNFLLLFFFIVTYFICDYFMNIFFKVICVAWYFVVTLDILFNTVLEWLRCNAWNVLCCFFLKKYIIIIMLKNIYIYII